MADNVVALDPDRVPMQWGEPDADVVEVCRDLLARAERGEISGIAYAICAPNQNHGVAWSGGAGTRHLLSSGILMLSQRYASALLERAKPTNEQA